jgi:hypothetical protein
MMHVTMWGVLLTLYQAMLTHQVERRSGTLWNQGSNYQVPSNCKSYFLWRIQTWQSVQIMADIRPKGNNGVVVWRWLATPYRGMILSQRNQTIQLMLSDSHYLHSTSSNNNQVAVGPPDPQIMQLVILFHCLFSSCVMLLSRKMVGFKCFFIYTCTAL